MGATDPNETLGVILTVRPRPGAPALPDLAYWTTTPPGSRTFLSTEEFGATYGAAPAELDQVAAFARSHGLIVTETNVPRRRVVVSGTAAQMSRAFAVELGRYESPTETHRGYDGYAHLPNDIADLVVSVCGLDNRPLGATDTLPNSVPPGTFPLDVLTVATNYNFPNSPAPSQTIGIFAISQPLIPQGGGFNQGDIQKYFDNLNSLYNLNLSSPTPVIVPGTRAANSPGNPLRDREITQDICVASTVAQGATIAVYFETNDAPGWFDFLQRAIMPASTEPKPAVISISAHVSRHDDTIDGFSAADITTFRKLASSGSHAWHHYLRVVGRLWRETTPRRATAPWHDLQRPLARQ